MLTKGFQHQCYFAERLQSSADCATGISRRLELVFSCFDTRAQIGIRIERNALDHMHACVVEDRPTGNTSKEDSYP